MKFKRGVFISILGIFLVIIPLLSADLTTDIANGDADYITDSSKWSNLTQNWKQGILSTGIFSGIDSFFKKINPVFSVLFGDPYSLSFFFFFVVILWFWFFKQFRKLFGLIGIFSKWVLMLISFAITVGVAQLGLFRGLSNLFVKIIFIPNKPWLGIIFFILILFILTFISRLGKTIEKKMEKSRGELEKEKEKINRKTLEKVTDSASKMFK
jgi:ABC-type multidrug transport system fused ATPase/permease subunit